MIKRKICVVTGSRAEYGLLYWLIKEVKADQNLELQLIVTGMHLSAKFGSTYKLIGIIRNISKYFEIFVMGKLLVQIRSTPSMDVGPCLWNLDKVLKST